MSKFISKTAQRLDQTNREAEAAKVNPMLEAIRDAQAVAQKPADSLKASTGSVWSAYAAALDAIKDECKGKTMQETANFLEVVNGNFEKIVPKLETKVASYATLRSYRSRFNVLLKDYPHATYAQALKSSDDPKMQALAETNMSSIGYDTTTAIVTELRDDEPESPELVAVRQFWEICLEEVKLCTKGRRARKESTDKEGKVKPALSASSAVSPSDLRAIMNEFHTKLVEARKSATKAADATSTTDMVAETEPVSSRNEEQRKAG